VLAAGLSLYLAAAMAAWRRWRSGRPLPDAALFAALWLLAELARGVLFTGFPWVAAGYAHGDGALAALAPWLGVYGIGAVSAAVAALAAAAVLGRGRERLVALAAAALLWWGPQALPRDFTVPTGTLSVALLQTNVAQEQKFASEHLPATLAAVGRALVQADADLVVAPETAVPLLPEQMPAGYWDALRGHFAEGARAALVGVPLGSFAEGYTNSVAGLSAAAAAAPGGFYRYDKHHLVPFGEFVPGLFRWFTDMMNIPLGDFQSGGLAQRPLAWQGQRIAPNICYEDLFGDEIGANFRDESQAPTVLLNVSNIAWFGDTIAIDQHLAISRMRALEFQRPMVRATNTGATAVIDHRGRVTHALPRLTRGVLVASVEGRAGLTPYAFWVSRFGLWPLWGLALAIMAAVPLFLRRASRTAG
jgi:apolipoprotein N-acyltransferase